MKVISVREAVELVKDGQTSSSVARAPDTRCRSVSSTSSRRVFKETGHPRDLTTVRVVGTGDFADRGFSQLAPARACTGARSAATSATSRALARMVENNELEAYSFPQGVL